MTLTQCHHINLQVGVLTRRMSNCYYEMKSTLSAYSEINNEHGVRLRCADADAFQRYVNDYLFHGCVIIFSLHSRDPKTNGIGMEATTTTAENPNCFDYSQELVNNEFTEQITIITSNDDSNKRTK